MGTIDLQTVFRKQQVNAIVTLGQHNGEAVRPQPQGGIATAPHGQQKIVDTGKGINDLLQGTVHIIRLVMGAGLKIQHRIFYFIFPHCRFDLIFNVAASKHHIFLFFRFHVFSPIKHCKAILASP